MGAGCDTSLPDPVVPPRSEVATKATPPLASEPLTVVVAGKTYSVSREDPEALLEFLNRMAEEPPGGDAVEQNANLQAMLRGRILAADALLALPAEGAHEFHALAARARLESWQLLASLGDPEARSALRESARSAQESTDPDLRRSGKLATFVADALDSPDSPQTGAEIVEQVRAFLQDESSKDLELYAAVSLIARLMLERGAVAANADVLAEIAKAFTDCPDESLRQLGAEGNALGLAALLEDARRRILEGEPRSTAIEQIEQRRDRILDASQDPRVAQPLLAWLDTLERTGESPIDPGFLVALRNRWEEEPRNEDRPKWLANLEAMRTRRDLIGQTLKLEGSLLDQGALDTKSLADRVVVLIAWRSDSPAALAAMQDIRSLPNRLKGNQSPQIVGLCLDAEPEAANKMLGQIRVTWPQLFSADEARRGFADPRAVAWGITEVPWILVTDREHRVRGIYFDALELETVVAPLLESTP